jgi:hypothetical protein
MKLPRYILTDAGLKIVAAIFHPDGSFEFRTHRRRQDTGKR